MMYQIRLRFYGTWQMTTCQRGGCPHLITHYVLVKQAHACYFTKKSHTMSYRTSQQLLASTSKNYQFQWFYSSLRKNRTLYFLYFLQPTVAVLANTINSSSSSCSSCQNHQNCQYLLELATLLDMPGKSVVSNQTWFIWKKMYAKWVQSLVRMR